MPAIVFATSTKPAQQQHQNQDQDQHQSQEQTATGGNATINIGTNGDGGVGQQSSSQGALSSNASNDGVTVGGDTSNVENNSSNVVLVPNNNTESCLRVFGFGWGKDGSSGGFGVPWRSKACDFEQAADDAFAGGERDLGWFWKCQNKNLYKQFKGKDESVESAIDDCHTRMLATTSTDEVVRKLEQRLNAADNQLDLMRRHKEVCDDSLERCTDKVYGEK
jgi:hypothetical protein